MGLRVACVTFDCASTERAARFWAGALGYRGTYCDGRWIVLGAEEHGGPLLAFDMVPEPKVVKNRVHLDLRAEGTTMEAEVRRLEGMGARVVQVYEHEDKAHTVMRDPKGSEFCVVEP